MRLNAFLAKAGITSRRKADELIKNGRIIINGQPGQLNSEVSQNDEVRLDGSKIEEQKLRYIILHKPAGYITTLKDEKGRRKVTDLINIPERVVPVGRLDYDTTGVLLLTNDGQLAHRLMHPSFKINKSYQATLTGKITGAKLAKLRGGVELEDGRTAPAQVRKLSEDKVELTIHEGRNHQVKRMLAAVDLSVQKLNRSKYGPINLEGLKPGQWRELTAAEVSQLKQL